LKLHPVHTASDINVFISLSRLIYKDNACYRRSNEDIVELLIKNKTAFKTHADVRPYLIKTDSTVVGRFALIRDNLNSDLVMVAFFEAMPKLQNLSDEIVNLAKKLFPQGKKICIGLDGHLNYGAGLLLGKYDEMPSYGLPYTLPYYPDYFRDFKLNRLFTFQFPITNVEHFHDTSLFRNKGITVRKINRKTLFEEIKIYTELNNKSFNNHIFWTKRNVEEDYEVFSSFRHLIKNENLLFAEYKGEPIGFLLWFPDFNQMLDSDRLLKINTPFSPDVLRYKYFNTIKKIRLAEIAVVPEFHHKLVDLLLLKRMFSEAYAQGYRLCEGGFISETNQNSINLTSRYIERITNVKVEPYRTYGVFEKAL